MNGQPIGGTQSSKTEIAVCSGFSPFSREEMVVFGEYRGTPDDRFSY